MFTGILAVEFDVVKIIPLGCFGFSGIVKYRFFFYPLYTLNIYLVLPYSLILKFVFVLLIMIALEWIVTILEYISKFLNIFLMETSTPIVVKRSIWRALYSFFITILLFWVMPIPPRLKGWEKSIMLPSLQIRTLEPYYEPIITISSSCYADLLLWPPST